MYIHITHTHTLFPHHIYSQIYSNLHSYNTPRYIEEVCSFQQLTKIYLKMGKKIVKFPSMFKKRSTTDSWQWPSSCKHPTTLSFRAGYDNKDDNTMFKTVNSIFLDPCINIDQTSTDKFTNFDNSPSLSDTAEQSDDRDKDDQLELIIRGVRSDRLFFEPCNSLLSSSTNVSKDVDDDDDGSMSVLSTNVDGDDYEELPFKESVVLAMESEDPYGDFKDSMLEMVESHGLKDWECLEELLEWYLKMNGKMNHGVIVQAFVDLLLGLAASSDNSTTSFSSAVSSFSTTSTTTSSPLSIV